MARYGTKNGADATWDGLEEPDQYHGYRVSIALKSGSEVISIPNACVQSHSVTINADGVSEETIEFTSSIAPAPFVPTAAVGSDGWSDFTPTVLTEL